MPPIDRRQSLGLLAAGAASLAAPRVLAQGPRALAVVEKNAGRVAFYALHDGRPLGAVPLAEQPHEMVADAAGRFAYVGGYGARSWKAPGAGGHVVWVVDLAQRRLARTIDLAPLGRLHGVRLDARGRLFVLSEQDSVLARFDRPATDEAPARMVPVGGVRSHLFVLRRDGTRAYVAETLGGAVIMVDTEDMGVAPVKRRLGEAPEALTLSRDEQTLYAIDRPTGMLHALDATTLAPKGQRSMRGEAVRVVTLRDGRLLVSNRADRSLTRLDPATLAEEARLPLPAPAAGLNLFGDTLYAALESDRVAIIDVARWRVTGGFATGAGPDTAVPA